jgi:iron complex transport system substrate-binding protein
MRVVSLLPAATEIVAALGAESWLAGVSHECDFPASVRGLPRVTASRVAGTEKPGDIDARVRALLNAGESLYTLDEPLIAALQPDVILTQALCEVCAVSESDVRALAARLDPEPRVRTLDGSTFAGVLGDIATVGKALGLDQAAATLCATIERRLETVHETLKAARAPRPRVAVIEWTDPVFAAGHWTPELVRRAGGVDVLAQPGMHSAPVDPRTVRERDPEVVLVSPCGYDVDAATALARTMLARPEWEWARERRVWALDANALLSRPGPRLADAVETMACIFAPAQFGAPGDRLARRLGRGSTSVIP